MILAEGQVKFWNEDLLYLIDKPELEYIYDIFMLLDFIDASDIPLADYNECCNTLQRIASFYGFEWEELILFGKREFKRNGLIK